MFGYDSEIIGNSLLPSWAGVIPIETTAEIEQG